MTDRTGRGGEREDAELASFSRRGLLGGVAAGAAAAAAGCSGDTPTPTPTQGPSDFTDRPIEVLHGWTRGDGARAIASVEDMFRARNPDVSLDLEPVGGTGNENLNSAIDRRLAAGNPPSSFASWPGPNLAQYEDRLGDVTEVWQREGLVDGIDDRAARFCERDGRFVAVPIGSHRLNNLFYNVTLLDRAGVDPATLTSIPAFVDALDTVDRETDAVPLAHAMQAPWTNLQLVVQLLLARAGNAAYEKFLAGEGDRGVVRRAFETAARLLEEYVNDDAATISFTEANGKLIRGEAATMVQGNWVYSMYRGATSFEYGSDWDWRPFPGTDGTYVFHLDAFVFPRDNPTPAKKDLWAGFVGQPDPQIAFSNRKGTVPLRTDFDSDRLAAFPRLTWTQLAEASAIVPTLAHGLAVDPATLERCKAVVADHFMGPFDVEAATDGLLAALER